MIPRVGWTATPAERNATVRRTSSLLFVLLIVAACDQAPGASGSPALGVAEAVPVSSTMYRGGPERTGVFPGPAPEGEPGEAWRVEVGAAIESQPAVLDGLVYVTAHNGNLYAFELSSGEEAWRYEAGDGMSSSPAVANGTVVAVTNGGRILAVDATTGDKKWTRESGAAPYSMPAIVGDDVYVGTDAGTVISLDLESGDEGWSYEAGAPVTRSIAVAGDTAYFGAEDATFHAIDAKSGERRWTHQAVGALIGTPTVGGGLVYAVTLDDTHPMVVALESADGSERWRFEPEEGAGIRPVVFAGQTLYVTDRAGVTYALDPTSGAIRASFPQDSEVGAAPALVDGHLYVAAYDRVFAVDVADGTEAWSFPIDASVEFGPVVADGLVIVGTHAGSLYAIGSGEAVARASSAPSPIATPESNEVAEHVRTIPPEVATLFLQGPAVADDGTTYLLAMAGRVLVFDGGGSLIREFGEPGSDPGQLDFIRDDKNRGNSIGDVAIAPDGTLWIANPDNFRVDHFAGDGEYLGTIGSYGSEDGQFLDPIGVTVSDDGRLYVVDDERDVIQRFAPDGTFETAFGGRGSGPGMLNSTGFIELDAEGNVWVADFGNNRVQAFDADGAHLTSFGVAGSGPGQFNHPHDVALDAAGRVYVPDMGNERVQVFEPDGRYVGEFAVPDPTGSLTISNGELYVPVGGNRGTFVFRLLLPDA
jgi:eukaryotic-like serine/threonine-protein kinase